MALLVAVCLTACNRVPGKDKLVTHTDHSVLAADRTDPIAEPEEEPLLPICVRACGHWTELRFRDPRGIDRLDPEARTALVEMLDRQRALNRAACEEQCVQADDHRRARCILRAMTSEETEACALR